MGIKYIRRHRSKFGIFSCLQAYNSMKTPSTALFELIKSLSKSEKRYFKNMANLTADGKDKKYMRLFDYIDSQQAYNEAALKKYFHKEAFIQQLTSAKNYLYNLILKSLEHYYSTSTEMAYSYLSQVSILYSKGLYKHAEKVFYKLKKLVIDSEAIKLMPEILGWEYKLIYITGFPEKEAFKEIYEQVEKIKNVFEYFEVYSEISKFELNIGRARTKQEFKRLDQIIDHPIMTDVNKALTREAKRFYLGIYHQYYKLKSDEVSAYLCAKDSLRVLESDFKFIRKYLSVYTAQLINLAGTALTIGRLSEVPEYIKKVRGVSEMKSFGKTKNIDHYIFKTYALELQLFLLLGNLQDAVKLVSGIQADFEYYSKKLRKDHIIVFLYFFAVTNFLTKNYNRAIKWINDILNHTSLTNTRQDIQVATRILKLIIHYEMGDENYVDHMLTSTYRFLSKKEKLLQYERAILAYIKDIIKGRAVTSINDKLKALYLSLKKLEKEPLEKYALRDAIYLMPWLESKIGKKLVKPDKAVAQIVEIPY